MTEAVSHVDKNHILHDRLSALGWIAVATKTYAGPNEFLSSSFAVHFCNAFGHISKIIVASQAQLFSEDEYLMVCYISSIYIYYYLFLLHPTPI